MTTEMGDHDADPTIRQQVAGYSVVVAVKLMNHVSDDAYGRYNRHEARLSLYGESEDAGDAYERGRSVSAVTSIAQMWPGFVMVLMAVLGAPVAAAGGVLVSSVVTFVMLAVTLFAAGNSLGIIGLTKKIGVVDHTTEPTPDAVDELKERYVAGDLDDAELEREAAEVWEDA